MNTTLPFSYYRSTAHVSVQDLAHLLAIDGSNLSKVERGLRPLTLETVLLYHILFDVALKDFYSAESIQTLRKKYINRGNRLISNLKFMSTPKSRNRLKYIESVVNTLNNTEL